MTVDDMIYFAIKSETWWAIYTIGYLISFAVGIARTDCDGDFAEYVTLGFIALFWPIFAPFIILGVILNFVIERLKQYI